MKKGERWGGKYRVFMKKIMNSRQYKQKLRKKAKKRWKNPDKKWITNLKDSLKSKANRRKHRIIGKGLWDKERRLQNKKWWTKERRKKWGAKMKIMVTPKMKRRISIKLEERYRNHPYLRERLSREKQEYYENNPEARKNLLAYWNKPERKIKAKMRL